MYARVVGVIVAIEATVAPAALRHHNANTGATRHASRRPCSSPLRNRHTRIAHTAAIICNGTSQRLVVVTIVGTGTGRHPVAEWRREEFPGLPPIVLSGKRLIADALCGRASRSPRVSGCPSKETGLYIDSLLLCVQLTAPGR
jgi:hypothetical protein